MRFLLLVAAFVRAACSGDVAPRASNFLAPAGVTYVDGSYHAGLTAGPLGFSSPVGQSVYRSAPVVDVAPVVYVASASKYAGLPTVQNVPGVADVPITRIEARPAVIQKTVDVARPAVKTQRYEVRRPAIQKQFYDIEERVVVRPAGSAVVEFDEPLSRTQKGPSVIRPTAEDVALSSAVVVPAAPVAVPSIPAVPAVSSISSTPAKLPSVEINLARSSASTLARSSFVAAPISAKVRSTTPTPLTYAAPAPGLSLGFARSGFSFSGPTSSIKVQSSFPTPISYPASSAAHTAGISSVPIETVSVSAPTQSAIAGVSSVSSGVSGISEVSFSTPAPEYPQEIVSTPAPQLSYDSVSIDSADFARSSGLVRSYPVPQSFAAPAPNDETVFRSELPTRRFTGRPTSDTVRPSLTVNYPNPIDLSSQSRFRSVPVYEGNLRSETNENQQKLIQLLTARGGVSEVGLGRSDPTSYPVEAGQVRARVLSATPSPKYAVPTEERVNTRRVVVSNPIETLQEVEVAEPVTKYERVRVDQPALVKTTSQDVVRVPTSAPVYGKTLSPIDEASIAAAYSPDWALHSKESF